jgi:hypothetical protein
VTALTLQPRAKAASAAVQLERQAIAVFVEAVVGRR